MKTETYNPADLAQALFEESGDALFLFDPNAEELIDVNPTARRLSGFSREALLRMPVSYLFSSAVPGGQHRLRQACRRTDALRSREGFFLRHRREGVWVPVSITVTRLRAGPKSLGLIAARDVSDLAERRRAEEANRISEANYRTLLENLEQCIFLKDAEYRFVAVNRRFCEAAGRPESEVLGKTDFDLYPREFAEKFRADDREVIEQGRRLEMEEQSLVAGKGRAVRVVKTPVRDASGRPAGVLGIFWDVTEQRELEAQLRQAQKMDAVGQLAGGVAHDFNNLLTAILGNLSLALASGGMDPATLDMVKAAESAARRAATLTGQLLGFSRKTVLRPEPTNLNFTAEEVVSILARTIDPRIALEVDLASDLWPVLADQAQMNQVLLNLCLNARDAMPDGGCILVQTCNVTLAPEKVRLRLDARCGEFVCLSVCDNGHGIPPEVRARIFEPFFTTKGPGKGTGLGLAMVFGIARQHQGWVECDSEAGRGTCFRLYVPRYSPPTDAPVAEAPRPDPDRARGTETILFVDDEAILRDLARGGLQRFGYTVVLAEDGQHALEVFERERDRIDLILLDLTMPRLSGRDAFRRLRALAPDVPILLASGYSAEQITPEEHGQIAGFVHKPYRPREIAHLIREVFDRRKARRGDGETASGNGMTEFAPSL